MTYVGMDVGEIRRIANEFQLRHDALVAIRTTVNASVTLFAPVWLGPWFAGVHAEWHQVLAPRMDAASTALSEAAARLRANADEQEAASGGSGAGSASAAWNGSATTVAASLRRLDDMTDRQEGFSISVVDDGHGHQRYLVLVSGVNPHHLAGLVGPDGHNLPQAGLEMYGVDPGIERDIKAALLRAGVPAGADIAIVGHSQGGIAAMNLAADDEFRSRYHLTDVVTAGSPIDRQAAVLSREDPVNYVFIEDRLDPVPQADAPVSPADGVVRGVDYLINRTGHQAGERMLVHGVGDNEHFLLSPWPYGDHAAHDPDNYASIAEGGGTDQDFDAYLASFAGRYGGARTEIELEAER